MSESLRSQLEALHARTYPTASDEVHGTNAECSCGRSACETLAVLAATAEPAQDPATLPDSLPVTLEEFLAWAQPQLLEALEDTYSSYPTPYPPRRVFAEALLSAARKLTKEA